MISHRHRCIFVHIPKTAGTSLESLIWPGARTAADLWMGFVDDYHNKYQTGGLQHLTARHIRTEVGADAFSAYFKFSFVRNPWDKAVSQYAYMEQRPDLMDFIGMKRGDPFKRYLDLTGRKRHVQWEPQVDFLQDADGRRLVEFVGRFESFARDAAEVLRRLGIPDQGLPHETKSRRGPYPGYYDEESRAVVADRYAADIRAFAYAFEPAAPC